MTKGAKTRMRRNIVTPEAVIRDGAGTVTMIRFVNYRDNPLAPTFYVSEVGGIFRENVQLIRIAFIDHIPNAMGVVEPVLQGHVVWKTHQYLLDARERMTWAMDAFKLGIIGHDGEHTRQ